MKNLQKYLICFTIGILIYILLNHKNNGFSVGGKKYGLYERRSNNLIADHIAESKGDAILRLQTDRTRGQSVWMGVGKEPQGRGFDGRLVDGTNVGC